MKHFFTPRVRVVLIAAVLLAIVLIVVGSLTNLNIPGMLVQGALTPLRSGASALKDTAVQFYNYMFEYEALLAENEQLKEQLSQVQDNARQAEAIARDNDRLRAMMGLTGNHEDYKLLDGYIISWNTNDWNSTFTINRGSIAGIEVGMCAITANNELAGLVSEVGPNYAIVKSIQDSSMEISASIASSGYSGMVQGGHSTGLDGLLRMDYLPSSAAIRNNDQVVTAGSTVYPRGLLVGHVVDAGFDDTGVAKYALLKPAADIRTLEQVFIVTEYSVG